MKSSLSQKLKENISKRFYIEDNIQNNPKSQRQKQRGLTKNIIQKMIEKYNISESGYFKKKINELIYNQDSLYACLFKEFLIFEDENEFLKKYYSKTAGISKLRNITVFYEKYSKMFPNYIKLPESTILYRNIQKKQKMIDKLQEIKKEEERQKNSKVNSNSNRNQCRIFHTTVNDSIINETNSFALNARYIYNYKDDDNNDKSVVLIEKIIETIDEADKAVENLTSRREIVFINSKNKLFSPEFSKILQSQSPLQKKTVIKPHQVQSGFSSTNTTSILSTNNNSHNTKDKPKAFEYKISQHLNGITKINVGNLTKLKKNTLVPSIISTPRQHYRSIYSPNNIQQNNNHNSGLNQRSLIHSQSQTSYIMHNQYNKNSNRKGMNGKTNSNNSLSNQSKYFSKIITHNKQTKLQKKYFEVEYFTHRSGKVSGIDLLKINNNDLNQYDSQLISPNNGLLSESQQNYFKYSFIRNNLSPVIRTKNNSLIATNRKQKSLISTQRIFKESKIANQLRMNVKTRLTRKKIMYN